MNKIISWNSAVNFGKIEGSDWTCPRNWQAKDALEQLEREKGMVEPEDIVRLADGRPQHLNLLQYTEGYHAVEIVDSQLGETTTEMGASNYYRNGRGMMWEYNAGFALEGGRAIGAVMQESLEDTTTLDTTTFIRPRRIYEILNNPVPGAQNSLIDAQMNQLSISPAVQSFQLQRLGELTAAISADTLAAELFVLQEKEETAKFGFALMRQQRGDSFLTRFDDEYVLAVKQEGRDLVRVELGAAAASFFDFPIPDHFSFNRENPLQEIPVQSALAQAALGAASQKLFGRDTWGIVDMPTTARNMYETLNDICVDAVKTIAWHEANR